MRKTTILLVLISIITSCKKEKAEEYLGPEKYTGEVSYKTDIAPFVKTYCTTGLGPQTGCHDAWIISYNGVKGIVDNGRFMATTMVDKTMPKANSFGIETNIPIEELQKVEKWINDGGQNN